MSAGLPYNEIGELTANEVAVAVHIKNTQQMEMYRTIAWIIYNGAALTGVAINDPKKFPSLENAFPSLFEKKGQQDWRVMKERMESFAKAKNANHV
jgi:hypothetical protein